MISGSLRMESPFRCCRSYHDGRQPLRQICLLRNHLSREDRSRLLTLEEASLISRNFGEIMASGKESSFFFGGDQPRPPSLEQHWYNWNATDDTNGFTSHPTHRYRIYPDCNVLLNGVVLGRGDSPESIITGENGSVFILRIVKGKMIREVKRGRVEYVEVGKW